MAMDQIVDFVFGHSCCFDVVDGEELVPHQDLARLLSLSCVRGKEMLGAGLPAISLQCDLEIVSQGKGLFRP